MHRFLTVVIVMFLGLNLSAQTPDSIRVGLYGDRPDWDGFDQLYGATPTWDGGFAMNGFSSTYSDSLMGDQWVVKINAQGDTLWTKTFGTFDRGDYGRAIVESYDRGLVILGHGKIASSFEDFRIRLFKTDSIGNSLWEKNYIHADGYNTESIIETSDSGYAIVGWTDAKDMFLFRTDKLGDSLWTKTYGGSSNDLGFGVAQTSDGGFMIVGTTGSYGAGSYDMYIIRTDQFGDTVWTRTIGGTNYEEANAITKTNDGNYLIAGFNINTNYDVYLIKMQENGDTLWSQNPGQSYGNDVPYGITETTDLGFLIAGRNYSPATNQNSMFMIKVDVDGDSLWSYERPTSTNDQARIAYEGVSGNIHLFGTIGTNSVSSIRDYCVCTVAFPVGVDDDSPTDLPAAFILSHNYPNPFNPSTTIDYHLSKPAYVKLEIFDLLGRRVRTMVDQSMAVGSYSIVWDGTNSDGSPVATGMYFYRFKAGDFSLSEKMLLMK